MRSFYEMEAPPEKSDPGSDARVALFLQLAVLAFWAPCLGIDALLLWRDHGDEGLRFVFWLLFQQSLVFLALWFTVSIAHGLMRGRRTREPTRRERRRLRSKLQAVVAASSLSRYNRGQ